VDLVVLVVLPLLAGVVLGALVLSASKRWLVLPAVAIGVVYWVTIGWLRDDPDLERFARIGITGAFALLFTGSWLAGVMLGRVLRTASSPR
jgi:hypothetical protein